MTRRAQIAAVYAAGLVQGLALVTFPAAAAVLTGAGGYGLSNTQYGGPLVPQALATFEMPILLSGDHAKVARRLYILADNWEPSPFRYFAGQVQGQPGWRVAKLPCGHDVMVDMPAELAAELMTLA